MKAQYIKADGTVTEFIPKRKYISYEEMKKAVSGLVEFIDLPSGKYLVCHEEARLVINPVLNEKATEIFKKEFPIEKYPYNNDGLVFGDVIICDADLLEI